jgi:nucleotide-binding universal stress UspA family protein
MAIVLLCTDGSPAASRALAAGLDVLGPAERTVVATVIDPPDPSLVTGTGLAAGVMTPEEYERADADRRSAAQALLDETVRALGLDRAETMIVEGKPGPALCDLAASLPATVVAIGTHGHGGFRRAVLGSVSDHVVRNAPCPVLTTAME